MDALLMLVIQRASLPTSPQLLSSSKPGRLHGGHRPLKADAQRSSPPAAPLPSQVSHRQCAKTQCPVRCAPCIALPTSPCSIHSMYIRATWALGRGRSREPVPRLLLTPLYTRIPSTATLGSHMSLRIPSLLASLASPLPSVLAASPCSASSPLPLFSPFSPPLRFCLSSAPLHAPCRFYS